MFKYSTSHTPASVSLRLLSALYGRSCWAGSLLLPKKDPSVYHCGAWEQGCHRMGSHPGFSQQINPPMAGTVEFEFSSVRLDTSSFKLAISCSWNTYWRFTANEIAPAVCCFAGLYHTQCEILLGHLYIYSWSSNGRKKRDLGLFPSVFTGQLLLPPSIFYIKWHQWDLAGS